MIENMTPKKTILITGAGGSSSIFLINHLKKNNLRVIAVDANPHAPGLRYGDVNFVVPNCLDIEYAPTIQKICSQEKVGFIIPVIDEELAVLKALESNDLKVICPTIKFVNLCLDKFKLMRALNNIDICTPKTFLLSEENNFSQYPLVIKPRVGRGSRDVYVVHNLHQLNEIKHIKNHQLDNFLVQEKINGTEYTVSVVVNPNNEYITVVPKKIIEKRGITNLAITENQAIITDACRKVTQMLKPYNSFNTQLIINNNDKKPYIFEINPRYSTTVTLTIAAGVDEIMAPLHFYLNPNIKISENFTEGLVLMRSTNEEFVNYSHYTQKISKIVDLRNPLYK